MVSHGFSPLLFSTSKLGIGFDTHATHVLVDSWPEGMGGCTADKDAADDAGEEGPQQPDVLEGAGQEEGIAEGSGDEKDEAQPAAQHGWEGEQPTPEKLPEAGPKGLASQAAAQVHTLKQPHQSLEACSTAATARFLLVCALSIFLCGVGTEGLWVV